MRIQDLEYGDESSFHALRRAIKAVLEKHKGECAPLVQLSHDILKLYREVDIYTKSFTGLVCRKCPDPCCVNRHAYPDVEDLIFFEISGLRPPSYAFDSKDTAPCMFLTKKGCMLPRPKRSYRCTWYFCEKVLDEFEKNAPMAYRDFENILHVLSTARIMLTKGFYALDPSKWEEEDTLCKFQPQ